MLFLFCSSFPNFPYQSSAGEILHPIFAQLLHFRPKLLHFWCKLLHFWCKLLQLLHGFLLDFSYQECSEYSKIDLKRPHISPIGRRSTFFSHQNGNAKKWKGPKTAPYSLHKEQHQKHPRNKFRKSSKGFLFLLQSLNPVCAKTVFLGGPNGPCILIPLSMNLIPLW